MSVTLPSRGSPWLVWEATGRWAAALRLAIARKRDVMGKRYTPHQVREARTLSELEAALHAGGFSRVFVEVRRENIVDVLSLLSKHRHKDVWIVVLLGKSARHDSNDAHIFDRDGIVIDALREAGATGIAETPRHLGRFLDAAGRNRTATCRESTTGEYSITELAWNAVPWQDG